MTTLRIHLKMIMKTLRTFKGCVPSLRSVYTFLSEYSSALLAAGATCIRLEKNIKRIADTYYMDVGLTILPRHIHLTLSDRYTGDTITAITSAVGDRVSFTINTEPVSYTHLTLPTT